MGNKNKNPDEIKYKKGFLRRDILKLISFAGLSTLLPSRASAKDDFRNDKNVPKFVFGRKGAFWGQKWKMCNF